MKVPQLARNVMSPLTANQK